MRSVLPVLLLALGLAACSDDDGQENQNQNQNNQSQPICGNGTVEPGEQCDQGAQNSDTEPGACRTSCRTAYCSDGVCDPGEDVATCTGDCLCGNGVCDPSENAASCAGDCFCGNGTCDATETLAGCWTDCHCGDGTCAYPETPELCPADCTCGDGRCEVSEVGGACPADCPATSRLDLLFVIDNSGTMVEEQALLRSGFPSLLAAIEATLGRRADLHVGVISTDVGGGSHPIVFCEAGLGDAGRLLPGLGCIEPAGSPWIADVEPTGCEFVRDPDGICYASECEPEHCEAHTTLVADAKGCPRCVNHAGETLDASVGCLTGIGFDGCGFEQPLEALRLALDAHPDNAGFLREDAVLAVIIVTDEDDCSMTDYSLLDSSNEALDSPLGPFTSFRCFEFGITCDENDRTFEGVRHDCVPRSDPGALLHPLDRYTGLLAALRDPGRLLVAAVAGPVSNGVVETDLDAQGRPMIVPSCTANGAAVPGVRLRAFVERFTDLTQTPAAYSAICTDLTPTRLGELGAAIGARLE